MKTRDNEIEGAFRSLIGDAAKNVITFDRLDLSSIKKKRDREMLLATQPLLFNCLKSVNELRGVYEDLIVCYYIARRFPWTNKKIKRSQHLHFVWSQFVHLCYLFEEKYKLAAGQCNTVLKAFRENPHKFDVKADLKRIDAHLGNHIRARGQHLHEWNIGYQKINDSSFLRY